MWGLLPGVSALGAPGRSIPTHVGFTLGVTPMALSSSVHPHACGVYSNPRWSCCSFCGPSPRMWGLRLLINFLALPSTGPSPRMWGLLMFRRVVAVRFWSIPTHVGFTLSVSCYHPLKAVHPHACGVYVGHHVHRPPDRRSIPTHVGFTTGEMRSGISNTGPSPRMWGLLQGTDLMTAFSSVHPHACGVYFLEPCSVLRPSGPSPRMWGLH